MSVLVSQDVVEVLVLPDNQVALISQDVVEIVINIYEEGDGDGDEEFALTGMIVTCQI